jgi:hypothetical protein
VQSLPPPSILCAPPVRLTTVHATPAGHTVPHSTPDLPASTERRLRALGLEPTPEARSLPADGREGALLARYAHLRDVRGMVAGAEDIAPCEAP